MKAKRSKRNPRDKIQVTLAYRPVEGQPARLHRVMSALLRGKNRKLPNRKETKP